ncbi:hypothetical protein BTJ49_09400 [Oleiagrimonas sp. MCCC 1A03011]|nr:DUF1289 domain-containing protein [Oleiagrimonas sp. MCCC 1A03011]RAP57296.1 hypothetical protein BTJ49_09400 [Oleiagrimonas sp. MCCC 1A03011]
MVFQARLLDESEPLTPCVKVCRLDEAGFCVGCKRSVDEIMRWGTMSQTERLRLMREELPKRWPA